MMQKDEPVIPRTETMAPLYHTTGINGIFDSMLFSSGRISGQRRDADFDADDGYDSEWHSTPRKSVSNIADGSEPKEKPTGDTTGKSTDNIIEKSTATDHKEKLITSMGSADSADSDEHIESDWYPPDIHSAEDRLKFDHKKLDSYLQSAEQKINYFLEMWNTTLGPSDISDGLHIDDRAWHTEWRERYALKNDIKLLVDEFKKITSQEHTDSERIRILLSIYGLLEDMHKPVYVYSSVYEDPYAGGIHLHDEDTDIVDNINNSNNANDTEDYVDSNGY